jgi:hypothetical protein
MVQLFDRAAQTSKGRGSMDDILDELKAWQQQLRLAPHSAGEVPRIEIARLGRAITEIVNLRAELKGLRETYKS